MFNLKRIKEAQNTGHFQSDLDVQQIPNFKGFVRGRKLTFNPSDGTIRDENDAAIFRAQKVFFRQFKNGNSFDLDRLSKYLKEKQIIKQDDMLSIVNPKEHFLSIGFWGKD